MRFSRTIRYTPHLERPPMADIRIVQPQTSRTWLWIGLLAVVGLLIYTATIFFGDPTDPDEQPQVGAGAGFGEQRAPVLPMDAAPFQTLLPLQSGDLGRLTRLTGSAETRVVNNAVWVRTEGGYRILVRFEPPPPEGALSGISPGASVELEGYLQRIAAPELRMWADTLGVRIPRPPAGQRFGDLPPPEFARIDSLFIREFYLSVRPEGIDPDEEGSP